MFPSSSRTRLLTAGVLLMGALGLQAVPESLVRNSPFQPEKGSVQPAAPQAGRFELRGILSLDGKTRFTIFDTSNSKAVWLAVGESEGGIKVVAYDAAAQPEAVTVECEGQSSRLTMKEAQIVNVAVALPTAAPTPAVGAPPNANPAPPANEQEIQERRNRIIEELRRRRALRQANRQQQPPQQ